MINNKEAISKLVYDLEGIVCSMCDGGSYACFNCDVKDKIKNKLKENNLIKESESNK